MVEPRPLSAAERLLGRSVALSVVDPSAAPPPRSRRPRALRPPAHLTPRAVEEWRRILRVVDASAVDMAAVAIYCQAWARWVEAEVKIAELGLILRTEEGFTPNPYVKIALDASRQVERMLRILGLGIAEQ